MTRMRLFGCLALLMAAAGCGNGGPDAPVGVPTGLGGPPGADFEWAAQATPVRSHLYGVFFADSLLGWAVGELGIVLRTEDAGTTWERIATPTSATLKAVWFTSRDSGFAVGSSATVLVTGDGGQTWERVLPIPATADLNDVWFAGPNRGLAVGTGGVVLRTADGGTSWARVTAPSTTALRSVALEGLRGWIVGDGGTILRSADAGVTWSISQPTSTIQNLSAVWATDSLAWAVGAIGTFVLESEDQWGAGRSVGSAYDLRAVCFPERGIGYAAGWNGSGAILRSDDGGVTWTPQRVRSQYRMNGVFLSDSLHGWAVGDNGTVVHTAHGGHL
jgi:photosystem II stability/assembly factor-like uncharacterized protein